MADDTKSPEWTLFGMTRGDWSKMGLGFLLATVGAIFLNWWNAKTAYLRITATDTVTFPGVQNQFAIVGFSVINDGSKEAEDVQFSFDLPESAVQEVRVMPDAFGAQAIFNPKTHQVIGKMGTVNVGESYQVSAMVTKPDRVPSKITPRVRGKGIVGTFERRTDPSTVPFVAGIITWVVAYVAFLVWFRRWLQRLPLDKRRRLQRFLLRIIPGATLRSDRLVKGDGDAI